MSLQEDSNIQQYTVTDSTSSFEFPYKYWEDTDLKINIVDLFAGTSIDLDYISGDYSVSATNGDPSLGATINTAIGYSNSRITIERIIPVKSESTFVIGDGIPPNSLNSEFDKAAAQRQQVESQIDKQLSHPSSDPSGLIYEVPVAEVRAGKLLAWDSEGSVATVDPIDSGTISVDPSKGIGIENNVIFGKTDGVTTSFDQNGNFQIENIYSENIPDAEIPVSKIGSIDALTLVGNISDTIVETPDSVPVAKTVSDDSGLDSTIPTTTAVKGYIDSLPLAGVSEFVSSQVAIPPDTGLAEVSVQHGLGSVPKLTQVVLICVTPELGYSAGDEVVMSSYQGDAARFVTIWSNSTSIGFAYNIEIALIDRSGTGVSVISIANWEIIFRGWK